MGKIKQIFTDRSKMFFVELGAAVIALVCSIYYIVQSSVHDNFNLLFFVMLLLGVILTVLHCFIRYDFFVPVIAALFGIATGVGVFQLLPPLSDVWNNVKYMDLVGALPSHIVYTILAFVAALAVIIVCFTGTGKKIAK